MSGLKPCLLAATLLTGVATPALAQQAAPAPSTLPGADQDPSAEPQASAGTGQLEEIVVTARKREESLNDIPIAVTALTPATIERAGVTSIEKLNALVPSFTQVPAQDPGTNVITIRGITQVRFGEPPVALVIDGVQASSPDQGTQELTDVERIEVLKGPQGATYGRNAIGGAINIVTRAPTNDPEQQFSIEGGSGNYFRLFGATSGPIVDDVLLYRISGAYKQTDGRIKNVTVARKVDDYKDVSLRGRLIFKPSDRLSFDLRGSYEHLDGGSAYYFPIFPGQDPDDVQPVVANRDGKGVRRLHDFSLRADLDLGGSTLTSISAYAYSRAATLGQDLDFLPYPLAPGFGGLVLDQDRRVKAWSEELRLTSAADKPLRWLVGAYYLKTRRDVSSSAFLDLASNLPTSQLPRLSYLPESNRNNAYALFANVDYDISQALKLSVGLRQDWDDRNQTNPATGSRVSHVFKALQPKLSLTYFFTPDKMVYISGGRGFRSGGFNAQSQIFPRQYGSETANTYEIGSKLSLADRHIQLNLAGFYTDQKNVQFYRWDSQSAAQGILTIRSAYHYGVEGDVTAQVSRRLRLMAGVSLIDSKVQDFNGTPLWRGNELPHVNGWKYNLAAQYELPLGGRTAGILRVDYSASGDLYWFVDNLVKQRDVHLVNARFIVEHRPWTFTLSAENLFNTRYNTDYFSAFFAGTPTDVGFPNQPRQVVAKVAVRF